MPLSELGQAGDDCEGGEVADAGGGLEASREGGGGARLGRVRTCRSSCGRGGPDWIVEVGDVIGEAVAISDRAVAPSEVLGEAIGGTQGVGRSALVASGGLEQDAELPMSLQVVDEAAAAGGIVGDGEVEGEQPGHARRAGSG